MDHNFVDSIQKVMYKVYLNATNHTQYGSSYSSSISTVYRQLLVGFTLEQILSKGLVVFLIHFI